ncbi:hypothetical protein JW948_05185 [bacterium]|nr:hypothetical protein [bacterium]
MPGVKRIRKSRKFLKDILLDAVFLLCFSACMKDHLLDDVDMLTGTWELKALSWTQNSMIISVPPSMRGFQQILELEKNGFYECRKTPTGSDTALVDQGRWSIRNHQMTMRSDTGSSVQGDYTVTQAVFTMIVTEPMITDNSGQPKPVSVTYEYHKPSTYE